MLDLACQTPRTRLDILINNLPVTRLDLVIKPHQDCKAFTDRRWRQLRR